MKPYFVTWKIDIWAECPTDAAIRALDIQRDSESIGILFEVQPVNENTGKILSKVYSIDLWKDIEEECA